MVSYATNDQLAEWTSTAVAALPPDRATLCLAAASRLVDDLAGRTTFGVASATATQRQLLVAPGRQILIIPDAVEITAVRLESATGDVVPDDDWAPWPDEAPWETPPHPYEGLVRLDGAPWFYELSRSGAWRAPYLTRSPVSRRRCRAWVTARWGWEATPDVAVQATLLQAAKLLRLKDAPLGMLENPELGTISIIRGVDPSMKMMLKTVKRRSIVGGGR